ncbi:GtrA family protein [Streptomyces sp. TRM S81-3]|uniref:GtrA family protein n=1 Tax=Streptomyces griseicoloratus TaxID=2752516 RepID=A0A926L8B6_9ACTN|nr:GtrA family protein [Streptomyces griseicoloratus]MBD0422211.1 GtrA family protein [Streptomyces griseicoloratus]
MARPKPSGEARATVGLRSAGRRARWSREVGWFVVIGIASTVGQALLYWSLRGWWPPAVANLVSLLVLTVLNTEANRRLTFRHAAARPVRAHLGAGGLFLLGYLVTSGAVLAFKHVDPGAPRAAESLVLAATSVLVTVVRFAVLRWAVFRGPGRGDAEPSPRGAATSAG